MIYGSIQRNDRPMVTGLARLPNSSLERSILFLVDTGAEVTMLHPFDAEQLGLDFAGLGCGQSITGIGGSAKVFNQELRLLFQDADTGAWYEYSLTVLVAAPTEHNESFPYCAGTGHFALLAHGVRSIQWAGEIHGSGYNGILNFKATAIVAIHCIGKPASDAKSGVSHFAIPPPAPVSNPRRRARILTLPPAALSRRRYPRYPPPQSSRHISSSGASAAPATSTGTSSGSRPAAPARLGFPSPA